jgi:hypothetical protein
MATSKVHTVKFAPSGGLTSGRIRHQRSRTAFRLRGQPKFRTELEDKNLTFKFIVLLNVFDALTLEASLFRMLLDEGQLSLRVFGELNFVLVENASDREEWLSFLRVLDGAGLVFCNKPGSC